MEDYRIEKIYFTNDIHKNDYILYSHSIYKINFIRLSGCKNIYDKLYIKCTNIFTEIMEVIIFLLKTLP